MKYVTCLHGKRQSKVVSIKNDTHCIFIVVRLYLSSHVTMKCEKTKKNNGKMNKISLKTSAVQIVVKQ